MIKALLLLACAACTEIPKEVWSDGTPVAVVVETNASPASSKAFVDRMRRDLDMWNAGVVAKGCEAPFRYVESASDAYGTITLRDRAHWALPGAVGGTYPDAIYILSEGDGTLDSFVNDPTWTVGLHEMGHALGLEHNSYSDSVMYLGPTVVLPLSDRDATMAAAALGCN